MQIGGTYTIDFAKLSKIPKFEVTIKTGDSKRTIKLILLKNSEVLNLNNYTVTVAAKKSDGTKIFNDVKIIDAESGMCEVEITEQMLALDIDLPCEIILYNSDGVVASSSNFVISKISSLKNEESIVSSNEFTALTKALSDVTYVKTTLNKKRDLSVKINNSDLDTSSDETKIQPLNLSTKVKEMMTGTTPVSPTPAKFSVNRENVNELNTDILKEKKILNNNHFNKFDIKVGYLINPANGEVYERDSNSFVTNYIIIKSNFKYSTNMNQPTFYDIEGNFISCLNDARNFTSPSNARYIRLSGGIEYLDTYSLSEGEVTELNQYLYTFEGLGSSSETRARFSEIDKVTTIVDTIEDVQIKKDVQSINVKIIGNESYFNSFYIYKNNKYTTLIKTDTKDVEFSIPFWHSLILDLDDAKFKVINENIEQKTSNYILLLSHSVYSNGLNGFLAEKFTYIKTINILNSYNDMIKTTDLYIKSEKNQCSIKFKDILINRGSFYKTYSFDKAKNDLGIDWIYQNTDWVENCIKLPNNFVLAFNTKEEKFKIATLGNFTEITDVMLAFNNEGILQGLLSESKVSSDIKEYDKRNKIIDDKYIDKIKEKENIILTELNNDDFLFGFATDTHIENSSNGLPNLIKLIMNRTCDVLNVDAILNGGDSVSYGKENKELSIDDLKNVINDYNNKSIFLHAVGNHDFNGVSDFEGFDGKERKKWLITKKELYNITQRHLSKDKNVHFGSKEDLYFYKDFEDKKIRVIVLNTSDLTEIWEDDNDGKGQYLKYTPLLVGGVRQSQLDWLANTALNFSNKTNKLEWHTMVLCHIGLYSQDEGLTWNTPLVENKNVVRDILANFISGSKATLSYSDSKYEGMFNSNISVDFTLQGAMNFIGIFSGHNHLDRIVKDGKLNQVSTTAGYPDYTISQIDSNVIRKVLDYTEFAFDIVRVDKTTRTVKMYRFGSGEDRTFNY